MSTYSIICKTDLYHAQRYPGFGRLNGTMVLDTNLSLKDAQKKLLEYFNNESGEYHSNWGIAVARSQANKDGIYNSIEANKTYSDGTRSYTNDVFTYSIVEDIVEA